MEIILGNINQAYLKEKHQHDAAEDYKKVLMLNSPYLKGNPQFKN